MVSQENVNKTLHFIKKKYPDSNDNGLTSMACGGSPTPLSFIDNDSFLTEVNVCFDWMTEAKTFGLRKTPNRLHSSYGIKHIIERHVNQDVYRHYVSNLSCIVAMILSGLTLTLEGNSPNPVTNISEKAFKKLGKIK